MAQLIGKADRFKKIWLDGPDDPRAKELLKRSHGRINYDQPQYVVEKAENNNGEGSPSQFHTLMDDNPYVSSANGGEYRKTYHG